MTADTTDDLPYRAGVGMMLVNPEGRVLVARRNDMDSPAWQMPQGGIDGEETPAAAARRELEEEIGTNKAEIVAESAGWLVYDFPADMRKKAWKGRYRGQRQKWFLFRFTGSDGDIGLGARDAEFNAWKWIEPDELPALIVAFKRGVYEDVLAEFSDVLDRLRREGPRGGLSGGPGPDRTA